MSLRRWVSFLLLNILVSASVVLLILNWWDSRQPEEAPVAIVPTISVPTPILSTGVEESETETEAETEETEDTGEEEAESDNYLPYSVQPGDTLGRISAEYDVSVEDIMTLNNLANENVISVDQILLLPIGGLPTATPPATETPAATATLEPVVPEETPELGAGEAELEIAAIEGLGLLTQEAILLVNNGSQAVSLLGWTVRDTEGHVYTFEQVTLFGDGAGIRLHTEAGDDESTDLYWGLEEAIWQIGETVILRDAGGSVQAQFLIQ